jgi:predicted transcriptional regulator
MEKLSNLLFELSNEDRLRILLELEEKAMRLTHLSDNLNLTVQETARHLMRLSNAKLIKRGVNGLHRLTPYGEHSITLLPGFEFLSKNREYFTTHTLSQLPLEFIIKIGDLKKCTFEDDVMKAFHNLENMIQNAQKYVWLLTNQVLISTQPLLEKAVKRGFKFRLILPENLTPPQGFKPTPVPKLIRTTKKVEVTVAISEKGGGVSFPTSEGKIDYWAFRLVDERAHKWCRDLFLHYWERAKPGIPKAFPATPYF